MENLSSDETAQNDAIRGCPDRACHRLDEFSPVYPPAFAGAGSGRLLSSRACFRFDRY